MLSAVDTPRKYTHGEGGCLVVSFSPDVFLESPELKQG